MSKNKKERKVRAVPVGVGILLFILAFGLGVASKLIIKSAWQKEYQLEWSDDCGTRVLDIAYDIGDANKYDLYLPKDDTKANYGLIVYLHPGGFTEGDKSENSGIMTYFTSRGYVVVGINYTLMAEDNGKNIYTQSMEIKNAIPKVIEEAKSHGYNINQMTLAGESAGHALAMIYAYRDADDSPVPVKLLFGTVGPSSFILEDWVDFGVNMDTEEGREAGAKFVSTYSGKSISESMIADGSYLEIIKPISAVMWIDGNTVPSVVSYAPYDKAQPYKGALRLKETFEANNLDFEFFVGEHSGHGLQNDSKVYKEYLDTVVEYLDKYMPVAQN